MKIERNIEAERISAVQNIREASPAGTQGATVASASGAPIVHLSGNAQNVQKLRDAVEQSPPVRNEKVEALRKKLQNGELHIDSAKLADILERQLGDV